MIARLLSEMQAAVAAAACPADLEQHLAGIAAIMENHFRYEETSCCRSWGAGTLLASINARD